MGQQQTCQSTQERTGLPCPARASWVAGIGTRKADEQAACGSHLSATCRVLLAAEGRRGAWLQVRRL